MNEQMQSKLDALVNNEEFLAELSKAEGTEEIRSLFEANGVTMTAAEIEKAMDDGQIALVDGGYIDEAGEMTEKGLDLVAGGASASADAFGQIAQQLAQKGIGCIQVTLAVLKKLGLYRFFPKTHPKTHPKALKDIISGSYKR